MLSFDLFALTIFTIGITAMFLISDENHRRRMRNRYLAMLRATARSRIYTSTDLRTGLTTTLNGTPGNLGLTWKHDATMEEWLWGDGEAILYEDTMEDEEWYDEESESYAEWLEAEYEKERDGIHTTSTGWHWG